MTMRSEEQSFRGLSKKPAFLFFYDINFSEADYILLKEKNH